MRYDIFANWRINLLCNFRCEYCFYSVFIEDKKKQNLNGEYSIEKVIEGFNKSGLIWLIYITGGEPFLQPGFLELCRGLTEKHYIGINTNLSTKNIYDFAKYINPEKVRFIHSSLHIDERKRLDLIDDFLQKYHLLKKAGFNIYVTQVLYPPVLEKFDEIFEFFKKNGVIVRPKIFRGYYKERHYPADYTQKEREKILNYFEISRKLDNLKPLEMDPALDKKFIYGNLSFKGLLCSAGKDFVLIEHNGRVMRCYGIAVDLGNIFEGEIHLFKKAEPCTADICPCPYYGLRCARGTPEVI